VATTGLPLMSTCMPYGCMVHKATRGRRHKVCATMADQLLTHLEHPTHQLLPLLCPQSTLFPVPPSLRDGC
jgi:hypothetical protein